MDSLSLDALLDQYGAKVYNLAYRVTGSNHEAEDIVQETFMQVYQNLEQFRGESNVYTWIYRIALNISLKVKANLHAVPRQPLGTNPDQAALAAQVETWDADPEKSYLMKELLDEMKQSCLDYLTHHLPEELRVVHILRNLLDFSYQEISEILGISENLVKVRLNRSRKKLKNYLENRCQWLDPDANCSCKAKIGKALLFDNELARRVSLKLGDARPNDLKNPPSIAMQFSNIIELYKSLPSPDFNPRSIKTSFMEPSENISDKNLRNR